MTCWLCNVEKSSVGWIRSNIPALYSSPVLATIQVIVEIRRSLQSE